MKRVYTIGTLAWLLVISMLSANVSAEEGWLPRNVFGLTEDNRLVTIEIEDEEVEVESIDKVTGLEAGSTLIGIDRRPSNGAMYAVARAANGSAKLYLLDVDGAVAIFVADLTVADKPGTPGGAPITLSSSRFGFDFNPAADALRIVGDTGENLRLIPSLRTIAGVSVAAGGTFVDGALNYEGTLARGIAGAAYTNNDLDASTGTTLYDLDTLYDRLVIQSPPNSGSLVSVGILGRPTTEFAGFDIVTKGSSNIALASLTKERGAPTTRLMWVDLASGRTKNLGALGRRTSPLVGVAF